MPTSSRSVLMSALDAAPKPAKKAAAKPSKPSEEESRPETAKSLGPRKSKATKSASGSRASTASGKLRRSKSVVSKSSKSSPAEEEDDGPALLDDTGKPGRLKDEKNQKVQEFISRGSADAQTSCRCSNGTSLSRVMNSSSNFKTKPSNVFPSPCPNSYSRTTLRCTFALLISWWLQSLVLVHLSANKQCLVSISC